MKNHGWRDALVVSFIVIMLFTACINGSKPPNLGPSVANLESAAEKQKDATEIIDNEATKIQTTSKEETSKASAGKIKVANVDLQNNIQTLEDEAKAKSSLQEELIKANEKITELQSKDNEFIKWVCRVSIAIGMLLTAIGLIAWIKSGFSMWEIGALGISLTVSAGITTWFFNNIIWFIIGIFSIAIVGVILWVFLKSDKVTESAVEVAEILKKKIKKLEAIELEDIDDDDQYVRYDDVHRIITDVFGDDTHSGIAGAKQSNSVVAHITAKRKKLHSKIKSIYE